MMQLVRIKILLLYASNERGFRDAKFVEMFPERFFDVGIAEQHAVTFAGGLACDGYQACGGYLLYFLQRYTIN